MNLIASLRLLAVPLLAVLLSTSVTAMHAASFQVAGGPASISKKKTQLPEGSASGIALLAAGVMGGGILIWRRKKRASHV